MLPDNLSEMLIADIYISFQPNDSNGVRLQFSLAKGSFNET